VTPAPRFAKPSERFGALFSIEARCIQHQAQGVQPALQTLLPPKREGDAQKISAAHSVSSRTSSDLGRGTAPAFKADGREIISRVDSGSRPSTTAAR